VGSKSPRKPQCQTPQVGVVNNKKPVSGLFGSATFRDKPPLVNKFKSKLLESKDKNDIEQSSTTNLKSKLNPKDLKDSKEKDESQNIDGEDKGSKGSKAKVS